MIWLDELKCDQLIRIKSQISNYEFELNQMKYKSSVTKMIKM